MLIKNRLKIIFTSFFLWLLGWQLTLAANLKDAFGDKIKDFAEGAGFEINDQNNTDPAIIVGRIIQVFLSFLGIIFLILILYAGYQYMTAGGNREKAEEALDAIKHAIIGLIIVLASYGISYFLVSLFSNQTLNFG